MATNKITSLTKNRTAAAVVVAILLVAGAALLWHRSSVTNALSSPSETKSKHGEPFERKSAGTAVRLPAAKLEHRVNGGANGFSGRVLSSADSRPIENASVSFMYKGAAVSADADASGIFTVKAGPGSYELVSASARGFLPLYAQLGQSPLVIGVTPGVSITDVAVYLSPIDPLTVVVQDKAGKRLPGTEVRAFAPAQGSADATPVVANAEGEAKVTASSTDVIEARHVGYLRSQVWIDQAAQTSRRLLITLQPGTDPQMGSIVGQVVTRAGEGADGALVEVWQQSYSAAVPPRAQTTTSPDGRFAIRDLWPGSYRLRATTRTSGSAALDRVAANGTPIEVRLGSTDGGIRGTVYAPNQKPVQTFVVVATPREGTLGSGPALRTSVIDPDGHFDLPLPPGRYSVAANGRGFGKSKDRDVDVGDGTVTIDFTLESGHRLFGSVVERAGGAPIANAYVTLETDTLADGVSLVDEAVTGEDGRFSFQGLAPGRTSINVQAQNHNGRILVGLQVPTTGDLGPLSVDLERVRDGEQPQTEFYGIGASIAAMPQGLLVKEVSAAGGANAAGIQPGDVILQIDGQDATALGYDQSIQLIRGPEGSVVTLLIRHHDGSTESVPVTRKRVTY